ncbi:MAG: hypothetical protein WBR26_06280 [Candidatus Acidiferrum sp.]
MRALHPSRLRIASIPCGARLIRKALPETKILSFSQYDIPEMVKEVEKGGSLGRPNKAANLG